MNALDDFPYFVTVGRNYRRNSKPALFLRWVALGVDMREIEYVWEAPCFTRRAVQRR